MKRSFFFDEVGGGTERAATDRALSDEGEETFDLIEPRGIGGREVNVPTRTACEPNFDLGMLVGGELSTTRWTSRWAGALASM
jgi:hypothetical protein